MVTTYQEAIDFLYNTLPSFSKQGAKSMTDLSKISFLCENSDKPHLQPNIIHVAGTNGKGSVCHMLASIMMEAGYRVGLHTSPHLIYFTERTQVNGVYIHEQFIVDKVNILISNNWVKDIQPSFFDVSIWIALEYFKTQKVDFIILETGLGGAKDTTNIVMPILSIITSIGWDHQNILGNTLAEIAMQKAGIIKPTIPVVIAQKQETEVFVMKAKQQQSPLHWAEDAVHILIKDSSLDNTTYIIRQANKSDFEINSPLTGNYQSINIRTSVESVNVLNTLIPQPIKVSHIQKGIRNVKTNTHLRARWDVVAQQPLIIVDGAHNVNALSFVIQQVNQLSKQLNKKVLMIFGMLKDKEINACFRMLSDCNFTFFFCQLDYNRAATCEDLKRYVAAHQIEGTYFSSTAEGLDVAFSSYKDYIILVTGSLYLAGEALAYLDTKHKST